ncbi:MAG: hypothetical protein JWR19_164 [Pedosphaera sp.]|nr:hypothetical protein [Pedosphaera sp.]
MNVNIYSRDLTRQAPHSPRERIGGFVIAARAVDKCRACMAGTLGEYHYNSRLDHMLFNFKGITASAFQIAVATAKTYEEVGAWLLANGTPKSPDEIKAWSDSIEASNPMKSSEWRDAFFKGCQRLGFEPEDTTTFDWLEADDRTSFHPACYQAADLVLVS